MYQLSGGDPMVISASVSIKCFSFLILFTGQLFSESFSGTSVVQSFKPLEISALRTIYRQILTGCLQSELQSTPNLEAKSVQLHQKNKSYLQSKDLTERAMWFKPNDLIPHFITSLIFCCFFISKGSVAIYIHYSSPMIVMCYQLKIKLAFYLKQPIVKFCENFKEGILWIY